MVDTIHKAGHEPGLVPCSDSALAILLTTDTLRDNLQTIRENIALFIKTSNEISLVVNSKKTLYMITCFHQNVVQNQNIVIANLSTVVARVLTVF